MASFAAPVDQSILALIFNATLWANIAINATSAPATNLYVSLHNANPGNSGSQSTNETAYTNYARQAVVRTSSGWTVGGAQPPSQASNAAAINFPQCGATGDTLSWWGLGLSSSGAGTLLASGPIGSGPAVEFTATSASPGVLTHPGYTPTVNDRVSIYAIGPIGTLPTGTTEGTLYFIGTAPGGVTSTLSTTTANGAPVNTSSTGSGQIIKHSLLAVSLNITPSFAINALLLYLD